MTEKERYELIIEVLTEKVKAQGEKITLQEWQIAGLKEKLAEAEFKLNENAKEERKPTK
jgi:hypothetical protein